MKKAAIVYHRVDNDGLCGCAIINSYLVGTGEYNIIDLKGWNYGDQELYGLENYDEIYLVDISFPPEKMLSLPKDKVVFIDHHITSIQSSIDYGYSDMKGIREVGLAGCELAWNYFYPNVPMPRLVHALGTYDTWRKNEPGLDWNEECLPLQSGLRIRIGMKIQNIIDNFYELCNNPEFYQLMIEAGRDIQKHLEMKGKSDMKNHMFPVTVAGKYKGAAILSTTGGSTQFQSVLKDYDVYVVAQRRSYEDGSNRYCVSMYSEPGRIDFNLGEYVKSFGLGGGGHRGGAASDISEAQFFDLITKRII